MKDVIELLLKEGWSEKGATQSQSYRSASLAYGGGSLVKLGGRIRLARGQWRVTVGKRTTCFYRKPETPEYVIGTGQTNLGRKVYTFRDWEQTNIPTNDIERIKAFLGEIPQMGYSVA